jgi:hypothetical protein
MKEVPVINGNQTRFLEPKVQGHICFAVERGARWIAKVQGIKYKEFVTRECWHQRGQALTFQYPKCSQYHGYVECSQYHGYVKGCEQAASCLCRTNGGGEINPAIA